MSPWWFDVYMDGVVREGVTGNVGRGRRSGEDGGVFRKTLM